MLEGRALGDAFPEQPKLKFPECISVGELKDTKCHLHVGRCPGGGRESSTGAEVFLCRFNYLFPLPGEPQRGLRVGHPTCCLQSEAQGTLRAQISKINRCRDIRSCQLDCRAGGRDGGGQDAESKHGEF